MARARASSIRPTLRANSHGREARRACSRAGACTSKQGPVKQGPGHSPHLTSLPNPSFTHPPLHLPPPCPPPPPTHPPLPPTHLPTHPPAHAPPHLSTPHPPARPPAPPTHTSRQAGDGPVLHGVREAHHIQRVLHVRTRRVLQQGIRQDVVHHAQVLQRALQQGRRCRGARAQEACLDGHVLVARAWSTTLGFPSKPCSSEEGVGWV